MRSMTGLGRAEAHDDKVGVKITAEVFSVNKKHLEIRSILPKELVALEPLVRECVSKSATRGMITVKIVMELVGAGAWKTIHINESLAQHLSRKIGKLQTKLELPGKISISDIIAVPGVVETEVRDYNVEGLDEVLKKALVEALENLADSKEIEGKSLHDDLAERVAKLKDLTSQMDKIAQTIPEEHINRLKKKLTQINLGEAVEAGVVERELVYFADKHDVSEELTRLRSHFKQFFTFLKSNEQVGRNLDFLAQEIVREITTLGNKAVHEKMSPLIIEFKTELDKIREQVRNVE